MCHTRSAPARRGRVTRAYLDSTTDTPKALDKYGIYCSNTWRSNQCMYFRGCECWTEGGRVQRGGVRGVRLVFQGGTILGRAAGVGGPDHGHVDEDSDGVVGGAQGRGRRPTGGAPGLQEVTERRVEPLRQRGGGRDGERLTSSRVARSTADTTCCGSPRSRRRRGERLRVDATARLAGHAVIEIGTHVEQGWWPATITWREEMTGGRLVCMRSSTTATRTPSLSSP